MLKKSCSSCPYARANPGSAHIARALPNCSRCSARPRSCCCLRVAFLCFGIWKDPFCQTNLSRQPERTRGDGDGDVNPRENVCCPFLLDFGEPSPEPHPNLGLNHGHKCLVWATVKHKPICSCWHQPLQAPAAWWVESLDLPLVFQRTLQNGASSPSAERDTQNYELFLNFSSYFKQNY